MFFLFLFKTSFRFVVLFFFLGQSLFVWSGNHTSSECKMHNFYGRENEGVVDCRYQVALSSDGFLVQFGVWGQPNFVEEAIVAFVKSVSEKLALKKTPQFYSKLEIFFNVLLNSRTFKNYLSELHDQRFLKFLEYFEDTFLGECFLIKSKTIIQTSDKVYVNEVNTRFYENYYIKSAAKKLVELLCCEKLSNNELVVKINQQLESFRLIEKLRNALDLFLKAQKNEALQPEISEEISALAQNNRIRQFGEKGVQFSVLTNDQAIQCFLPDEEDGV